MNELLIACVTCFIVGFSLGYAYMRRVAAQDMHDLGEQWDANMNKILVEVSKLRIESDRLKDRLGIRS